MLWKGHVHFQRPSASMDQPAKVAIIIKNLPACSRSVVRASKLELGGSWVWNFFRWIPPSSKLYWIVLVLYAGGQPIMSPIKSTMTDRSVLSCFFSNFDMLHLGKVHQNHWKSTLVNLPILKAIRLKWVKIQLRKVAKIYRCLYGRGAQFCHLPYMYKCL